MADRHNRDIDREQAPLPEALPVPTVDAHAHIEIVTNEAPDSDAVRKVLDDETAGGYLRDIKETFNYFRKNIIIYK
mgnify:CR=1 FL=1